MAISDREDAVLAALRAGPESPEEILEGLVAVNSHTENKEGSDRLGDMLETRLAALGLRTSVLVSGRRGRAILGRTASRVDDRRLLLLGHLDTVHPTDGAFSGYARVAGEDDLARGPGAADMKGGLVVMLEAIRALKSLGYLDRHALSVVINADEEVGSPDSADLIRGEAADSRLALCFEAGRPTPEGASTIVTSRRGFGRMHFRAEGRAAHAGVEPGTGASAALELCHKVVDLSKVSEEGCSLNVGVLRAGSASNTVAAEGEMILDLRFDEEDLGIWLEDEVMGIVGRHALRGPDGRALVATRILERVRRPPMVRTEASARVAEGIIRAGADLGRTLVEEGRGGSSDAALAADLGCPTICGLGVVGGSFHTDEEWIHPSSLAERAALAAVVMMRFFEGREGFAP